MWEPWLCPVGVDETQNLVEYSKGFVPKAQTTSFQDDPFFKDFIVGKKLELDGYHLASLEANLVLTDLQKYLTSAKLIPPDLHCVDLAFSELSRRYAELDRACPICQNDKFWLV
jgi:hypothetical protein